MLVEIGIVLIGRKMGLRMIAGTAVKLRLDVWTFTAKSRLKRLIECGFG
jgi:hypothetical protein